MTEEARTYNGVKAVYSTNDVGKIKKILAKNNETTPPSYIIHTRIHLKWIKDLNVRLGTIELLEENIGSKISDISPGDIFFSDTSPQSKETKEKVNKLNYIKLKMFCTAKETMSKMKRQPT